MVSVRHLGSRTSRHDSRAHHASPCTASPESDTRPDNDEEKTGMSGSRLQTSFGPQRVWVAAGIVVVLAAGAALGVALKALLAPSPVVPASPQYALVVA